MTTLPTGNRKKVTIHTLRDMKERGEPSTMLTAYDYPTARSLDRSGIEGILVGDSLGMVVLGYEDTLPVTMQDMLHHCKAVSRGAGTAHLVGDMPFMSYQASRRDAVRNAGRFLQEAAMDAVKLEGGREAAGTVRAIVRAGIPVMGHIGMTPQRARALGGWKVQGRSCESARRLFEDARILEDAGCYALVLEMVPDRVAGLITQSVAIPTFGIGSGAGCDGQVLVTHDLLGIYDRFTPRFVKRYADFASEMEKSFRTFQKDVRARSFPAAEHAQPIEDDEFRALLRDLRSAYGLEPAVRLASKK